MYYLNTFRNFSITSLLDKFDHKSQKLGLSHVEIFLLLFLILRIIFCLIVGPQEIPAGTDGHSYNSFALNILNNPNWLTTPVSSREPGYPLFLALIYYCFGNQNLLAVYLCQAVIDTLTLFYIHRLSYAIFGKSKAFLALLWAGFYGFYLWYNIMILRETLIFFFIVFSFYHLWLLLDKKKSFTFLKNVHLWLFSINFTLLIHIDARYLFYLPFFLLLFCIYKKSIRGIKLYVLSMSIITILMVPWLVRNYVAYDGFVLINTRTLDLREKAHANQYVSKNINNIMNWGTITKAVTNADYPSEKERKLVKMGLNPNKRSQAEINAIINNVYPASTLFKRKICWLIELWRPVRFSTYYFPFPDARFRTPWTLGQNLISLLCYGTLLPFMFVGIINLVKERNRSLLFLLFPIFIQTLLHVLQWGLIRYRMPIDSFIIIIAMYGLYTFLKLVRNQLLLNK